MSNFRASLQYASFFYFTLTYSKLNRVCAQQSNLGQKSDSISGNRIPEKVTKCKSINLKRASSTSNFSKQSNN